MRFECPKLLTYRAYCVDSVRTTVRLLVRGFSHIPCELPTSVDVSEDKDESACRGAQHQAYDDTEYDLTLP